jgi:hypothetical protein
MKTVRIAVAILACLLAVAACSKEEAHEEPVAEEGHADLPPVDATASQDAEAAIAAAMAASPTALEAPGGTSSGAASSSSAAASPAAAHSPTADQAPAH